MSSSFLDTLHSLPFIYVSKHEHLCTLQRAGTGPGRSIDIRTSSHITLVSVTASVAPPPASLLRLVQQNAGLPPLGFGARAVSKPRLASVLQITMIDRRAAVTPIQNRPPSCQHITISPAPHPQDNSSNTYATEQQLTAVVFPGHRYPFLPTPVEPHVPSIEMDTPALGA